MIIDSYDNKTKPMVSLKNFYGERKHLVDKCIIIFSKIIFEFILNNYKCEVIGEIKACNGNTKFYKFSFNGEDIAFYLSPIGSSMASQYCIECNWIIGASKFIMFGSAGSLDKNKTMGKFIIPTHAYRDEGMSYHYAAPQDYIEIKNSRKVKEIFDEIHIPYIEGRVWTTDAFLMETEDLTNKRREEGCIAVEMELAGVQAVCNYYGMDLYNFIVTGDVLSSEEYQTEELKDANHNIDKFQIALKIIERI